MSEASAAHWTIVVDSGKRRRLRRERLNMSIGELAEEAGVNRDTVSAIEKGGGSAKKRRDVDEALDRIEDERNFPRWTDELALERGSSQPRPRGVVESEHGGIVRIRLEGVFGAEAAVVEAPADNPDALAAALDIIMRRMQGEKDRGDDTGEGTIEPRP